MDGQMGQGISDTTKGAMLMLGCMAIIGLIDNYIKIIAEEAGLWQFFFLRSLIACGLLVVLAWPMGWRIFPQNWRGVAIRSFCAASAMAMYFAALAVLPVAQVGAGLFTAPIFVLILSVIAFRVPIGLWRVLAAGVGFAGVILLLRPDLSSINLITVLPLFAGFSWALSALSTRYLCESEDTVTLLFWFFGILGIYGAIGLIATALGYGDGASFFGRGWVAPTWVFWKWTSIQALGSIVAIGMLTRAYQIGETSYIAVYEYSFLIYASFWGWLLWSENLDGWSILGLAAIIGSGIVIAFRAVDE